MGYLAYLWISPNLQLHNAEFLTQLTLDASAVLRKEQIDKDTWGLFELQSREYLCKLHYKRLWIEEIVRLLSDVKDSFDIY